VSGGLPSDAQLVELREDLLTIETRSCVLPGTPLAFSLVMEGQPVTLAAEVAECLVVAKHRSGYVYHLRLPLSHLAKADRSLIALFISKGRGSPDIAPARP
jgi:hypothetical protein